MRVYLEPASIRPVDGDAIHVDAVTARQRWLIRSAYRRARRDGSTALVARWHLLELLALDTRPVTTDRLAAVG